jgi:dTDP-4-amino-4,6-dideoxygalactose transaminase
MTATGHPTTLSDEHRVDSARQLAELMRRLPDPAGTGHAQQLEQDLARAFGVRHAVAVSSGTAALHTALAAFGIGPGDEVLLPGACVVMTVVAVLEAGAVPVLVDSTPSLDVDFDDLERKTTSHTRAILPVHLAGRCADLARLADYAADRGLRLIEDACQAQGTLFDGRPAGTFGHAGCFSLKDGKILWSGEGGYILTDDADFAARARSFATHGFLPAPGQPPASRLGRNYRLAEPLAVIAHTNLAHFDRLLAHRRHQAGLLTLLLADVPGLRIDEPDERHEWNGYAPLLRIELPRPRDFCRRLTELGVPNSVGTYGLTTADRLRSLKDFRLGACPVARASLDVTLAVVVNETDSDARLHQMAQTITEEARSWA